MNFFSSNESKNAELRYGYMPTYIRDADYNKGEKDAEVIKIHEL